MRQCRSPVLVQAEGMSSCVKFVALAGVIVTWAFAQEVFSFSSRFSLLSFLFLFLLFLFLSVLHSLLSSLCSLLPPLSSLFLLSSLAPLLSHLVPLRCPLYAFPLFIRVACALFCALVSLYLAWSCVRFSVCACFCCSLWLYWDVIVCFCVKCFGFYLYIRVVEIIIDPDGAAHNASIRVPDSMRQLCCLPRHARWCVQHRCQHLMSASDPFFLRASGPCDRPSLPLDLLGVRWCEAFGSPRSWTFLILDVHSRISEQKAHVCQKSICERVSDASTDKDTRGF